MNTDPDLASGRRADQSSLIRILKIVVVTLSLLWVIYLLQDAWVDFEQSALVIDTWPLFGGLLVGVLATWLGFESFALLFLDLERGRMSRQALAHYYFAGQLMKHLPGRFFGVVYQISSTRGQVSTTHWLVTNAAHMLFTMATGLLLASIVLCLSEERFLLLLPLGLAIAIGLTLWKLPLIDVVLRILRRFKARLSQRVAETLAFYQKFFAPRHLQFIALLVLSWATYFLSWALYALALPELDAWQGVQLSSLYVIAWVIGYLSFVTPSGLGIRELAFTFIAFQFSPEVVAFGLILGRISLLIIDILLGLSFLRARKEAAT